MDGRLSSQQATEELYGGARINFIFHDVYGAYINSINNLANLTDDQIQVGERQRERERDSIGKPVFISFLFVAPSFFILDNRCLGSHQ